MSKKRLKNLIGKTSFSNMKMIFPTILMFQDFLVRYYLLYVVTYYCLKNELPKKDNWLR